jgi:hypothetical protein
MTKTIEGNSKGSFPQWDLTFQLGHCLPPFPYCLRTTGGTWSIVLRTRIWPLWPFLEHWALILFNFSKQLWQGTGGKAFIESDYLTLHNKSNFNHPFNTLPNRVHSTCYVQSGPGLRLSVLFKLVLNSPIHLLAEGLISRVGALRWSVTGKGREKLLWNTELGSSSVLAFLWAESTHQTLIKHLLCPQYTYGAAGLWRRGLDWGGGCSLVVKCLPSMYDPHYQGGWWWGMWQSWEHSLLRAPFSELYEIVIQGDQCPWLLIIWESPHRMRTVLQIAVVTQELTSYNISSEILKSCPSSPSCSRSYNRCHWDCFLPNLIPRKLFLYYQLFR